MKNNFSGLYNKHRPLTWDEVIGNEASVISLKNTLDRKGSSTVFLIEGHTGCGKTTLARICATELGCIDKMSLTEVNCVTNGTIDMVRDLEHKVKSSTGGKNRAFIFDEVHQLTAKAQDAILKIIEDTKPTNYFFFCTTDASGLSNTFKGRCQKVTINKLTDDNIEEILEDVMDKEDLDFDEDVLDAIIEGANGSAREAITILESIIGLDPTKAIEKIKSDVYVASESSIELKVFMKALMNSSTNFYDALKLLKLIDRKKESPEGIRLATINYANAIRMQGVKNTRVDEILDNLLYAYDGIYMKGQAWAFIVDKIYKICM